MLAPVLKYIKQQKTKNKTQKNTRAKMQILCVSWLEAELLFWVCSFLGCVARWKPLPLPPPSTAALPRRTVIYLSNQRLWHAEESRRRWEETTQRKLFLLPLSVFVFPFGRQDAAVSRGAPAPLAVPHRCNLRPARTAPGGGDQRAAATAALTLTS